MQLSSSFRQTEAGLIPADWDAQALASLGSFSKGQGIRKGEAASGSIPCIRYGEIYTHHNDIVRAYNSHISRAVAQTSKRLTKGDILFAGSGETKEEIGKAVAYLGDDEVYAGGDIVILSPHSGCSAFLGYLLNSPVVNRQKASKGQGDAVVHISASALGAIVVPVPPISEQRAIAEVLSDIDALVDGLDRLIAKKHDLKQAAMEQLLTGKRRLPGFHGNWRVTRLGDHATFLRNGVNSRTELRTDGPVKYLHYGDIHGCSGVMLAPDNLPSLPRVKATALDRLCDGDLIFADASEDMAGVSKSVEMTGIGKKEVVAGLHTIAARFDKEILAKGFKGYLQFCPMFSEQLRRLAAGTKVYATNRAHIASIEMPLPGAAEQAAIAAVLSDADSELLALEARRAKTRDIKQAMMQALLTGRTRLVKHSTTVAVAAPASRRRRANIHFVRSVLAAEIIDQLHEEPTFGHVKFEKMIFLVERLCGVETGSTYHRKAAGPYDNRALRSIDNQLRQQQWFDARRRNNRYQYVPMKKRGGHKPYFDRYFGVVSVSIENVLNTFRKVDTERCEIVATLLAAWEDLLRQEGPVSDQRIVHEVLHNWHNSKQRIPEDRWLSAIRWMRDRGIVPMSSGSR